MAYKIIVSPRAQKEIENAIDYYAVYSSNAPKNFIYLLTHTYNTIALNPFYKVLYKNIRALKIKKFPYSLYFIVDETKQTIKILACFHNHRSPSKRPHVK
jgi:plasmid stabilization system protein ParE